MAVSFHKMHGLGNDFVLLDLRHQDFPINSKSSAELADRHTGIGCDQVLVLRYPENDQQLASFEIWNSDGSPAEQCGNGVRCLGLYLHMRAETPGGEFLLAGPTGTVKIECLDENRVKVDMGRPDFHADHISVSLPAEGDWYLLEIDQKPYRLGTVSMGNPHAVMVVDDVDSVDVAHLGAIISRHSAFPEGCNAGFAEIVERENIRLRVYERGAAETRACGSGACAAVSVLRRAGLVAETVKVTQTGGDLILTWMGGEKPVKMMGPATHVFKGTFT